MTTKLALETTFALTMLRNAIPTTTVYTVGTAR